MHLIGLHRFGSGSPPFFHALINFLSKREGERERLKGLRLASSIYPQPFRVHCLSLIHELKTTCC